MGKTGRWLGSFFSGKKEKRKEKNEERSSVLPDDTRSGPLLSMAGKEEKRRWIFRRPAGERDELDCANLSAYGLSTNTAGLTIAWREDGSKAPSPIHILAARRSTLSITLEELASIRIQAAYRGHLARKALRALRGLVKLQALVRGHLVRKQATATLRCMEALVTIQARARAPRACLGEEARAIPEKQPVPKRSTSMPQSQNHHDYLHETIRKTEVSVKVVEIDEQCMKIAPRRKEICSFMQRGCRDKKLSQFYSRTESKHHYISPAQSEATTNMTSIDLQQEDICSIHNDHLYPSYMANTESSRAKARSQSTPRQRSDTHERQPIRRKRSSVESRNISRCVGIQRSSSQSLYFQRPWLTRLDGSSMSLKSSECGSTSTNFTSTNY